MWFLLFLQPVTEAALVLVVHGGGVLLVVVGVVVFATFQGVSLAMVYQVTGQRLRAEYVPRPWAEAPPDTDPIGGVAKDDDVDKANGDRSAPSNFLVSAFTPRGDWQPAGPSSVASRLHHSAFKPLYGPFHSGGRLFILADLVIALVFGAAGSAFPQTREQCMGQISVIAGAGFAYLVTVIVMRPFAVPIDNALLIALSFLEFAGAIALFVHVSHDPDSKASRIGKDWTDVLAALAIWLTFLIVIKDCFVVISLTIMKHCDGKDRRCERSERDPFGPASANPIARSFGGSTLPPCADDGSSRRSQARFDAASALDDDAWRLAPDCRHWVATVPDPAAAAQGGGAMCEVWQDPDTGRMYDLEADAWSVA